MKIFIPPTERVPFSEIMIFFFFERAYCPLTKVMLFCISDKGLRVRRKPESKGRAKKTNTPLASGHFPMQMERVAS